LENLTITVYVPEDRYGEISLGQQAEVNVDSFPGETFQAQVTYIADTAEYTPRNVQTVEGTQRNGLCGQIEGAGSGRKAQARHAGLRM
jgi:multidrug resistance efflux pump